MRYSVNSNQDQLDNVKQAFDDWRTSRPKMEKIPSYLWGLVKPLIDEFPIAMISRVLGLSYAQLKQNAMEPSVQFVEAITPSNHDTPESKPSDNTCHCDIELQRPCNLVV